MELIIFIFGVVVVYRNIKALSIGRPSKVGEKPADPQLIKLQEYAERLFSERKYVSAEKAFLSILKQDHRNAQAYKRLGLIYSAQRNFDDAIECFQIASQLDPNATNHYNLGVALFENQNFIKALAAFEKALIFKPAAEIYAAIGRTYQKMANTGKAIEAFERSVDLEPNNRLLAILAETYAASGQQVKAGETYRRLLEINPENTKARQYLKRLESLEKPAI